MRICMVAYTFYETDNRVMRYAEALVSRGDTVDVIALRRAGQASFARYRGVGLYRIQNRTKSERSGRIDYLYRLTRFLMKSSWFVLKLHLYHPYRVVHVHSVPDFEVFSALVPKMLGAKVILDIHDIVPEFYANKFHVSKRSLIFQVLVVVERLSIRFSDHVLVANHLWHDRLLQRSVTADKCTTVLNYPDSRIFYRRARTRADDTFVFLYPGGINYHQGVDIAIRAFDRVREEMPDARFWIYGDGPERRRIEALIRELHLSDRVLLFDLVPIDRVAEIMAEADVAIVPKRSDSFGNEAFSTKSLEFMSVGVPLIISETTIDRYYFNDAIVRFFRPGDDADLANQMRLLYRDNGFRIRLAKAATAFVAALSWDRWKTEYLHLIDTLSTATARQCVGPEKADKRSKNAGMGALLRTYYRLRPAIPRGFQIWARRRLVRLIQGRYRNVWPINPEACKRPPCFHGWPDGKQFALVLRHDVETMQGVRKCPALIEVDRRFGLKAGYFLVAEGYPVSEALRERIVSSGCEVGVHGLKHDGLLYESRSLFPGKVLRINEYLKAWEAVGFASPSSHHKVDWMHDLNILYDSSTFDTDPFEPQPDSLNTVFPVVVSKNGHSFVELPYTMPQDYLLYVIMRECTIQIWKDKLDWLVSQNAMVMFASHPDYMRFDSAEPWRQRYSVSMYQDFLSYVTEKYAGQYWAALPSEVATFWRALAHTEPQSKGKLA